MSTAFDEMLKMEEAAIQIKQKLVEADVNFKSTEQKMESILSALEKIEEESKDLQGSIHDLVAGSQVVSISDYVYLRNSVTEKKTKEKNHKEALKTLLKKSKEIKKSIDILEAQLTQNDRLFSEYNKILTFRPT